MITAGHIHPNPNRNISPPFRKEFSRDFVPDAWLFRRLTPDTALERR
jgi:hypothetical protein